MESMDNFRERFEALGPRTEHLQQHTRMVERRRCWGRFPWGMVSAIALGLALPSPHAVQAKTFYCGAGDVQCLIDAINAANANGQKNTIRLAAGTYTLMTPDNDDNGLPVITSPLTITGRGAEATIIERDTNAPRLRILQVAPAGTLTLRRLTLRGGGPPASILVGSGILNSGTLTVNRSTITDHFADAYAGIANVGGTVTITNSTIAHNFGVHLAGGLANIAGTMVITATTFAHNVADGGSAIFNMGTLTVTNSAFTDNRAFFTGQGSIVNFGTLEVINTTFARNVATGVGGAKGAAIANFDTLLLINSTLVDNQVDEMGIHFGSALLSADGATTLLQNTLLARNIGVSLPILMIGGFDCLGGVISLGTNLIGDPTGCTITLQPSDLTGDPGLDDFIDNGRPGNGHFPLLPTSQAIDAGSDAVCPRRDQIGQRRIGPCDIGAIEFRDKDDRQHDEEDQHDKEDQHDGDPAAVAQTAP